MDHKAFHAISYGVYVVSSKERDRLNGQIANTVFQTASDPPMIAVCLNKENLTHKFVQASRVIAVSVLSTETPMSFIGRFGFKSGRDSDKFTGIDYRFGVTGAPIVLNHGVAYLEAEIQASLDSATHTLFTARVVAAEVLDSDAVPMTYAYYQQVKRGRSPKTAPTYVAPALEKAQLPETEGPVPAKWVCSVCGYVYDPEVGDPDGGIAPGTSFEEIPADWVCPVCGVGKDEFEPATGPDEEAPKVEAAGRQKWVCTVCGYIYDPAVGDPDGGVAPGTAFEDISDDWVCPVCGVGKDEFEPTAE